MGIIAQKNAEKEALCSLYSITKLMTDLQNGEIKSGVREGGQLGQRVGMLQSCFERGQELGLPRLPSPVFEDTEGDD
jgi:hypothetical protein